MEPQPSQALKLYHVQFRSSEFERSSYKISSRMITRLVFQIESNHKRTLKETHPTQKFDGIHPKTKRNCCKRDSISKNDTPLDCNRFSSHLRFDPCINIQFYLLTLVAIFPILLYQQETGYSDFCNRQLELVN